MPIPTTVKIGAHLYRIVRVSGSEMPKRNLLGLCDANENTILLRKRVPLGKVREILLHEILHACSYPSLIDTTTDDESFVNGITPTLLQVLQDNPDLVAFLMEIT